MRDRIQLFTRIKSTLCEYIEKKFWFSLKQKKKNRIHCQWVNHYCRWKTVKVGYRDININGSLLTKNDFQLYLVENVFDKRNLKIIFIFNCTTNYSYRVFPSHFCWVFISSQTNVIQIVRYRGFTSESELLAFITKINLGYGFSIYL